MSGEQGASGLMARLRSLRHHQGLRKYGWNTFWLFFAKAITITANLYVYGKLGVYLEPTAFGLLNTIQGLVMVVQPLVLLGLSGLMVRELVQNPDRQMEDLGTAVVMSSLASLAATSGLLLWAQFGIENPEYRRLLSIACFYLLSSGVRPLDYWFGAHVRGREMVTAQTIGFLGGHLVRFILILYEAPLYAFALAFLVEGFLWSASTVVTFKLCQKSLSGFRFVFRRALGLLSRSWMLILSGFAAVVHLRLGLILLEAIAPGAEAGYYAAAMRLSEPWYFVPNLIAASLFPALIKSRELGEEIYRTRVQHLFDLIFFLSVSLAILTTVLAPFLVGFIYDETYAPAADVLRIHIWAAVFAFQGVILSKWLIVENLLVFSLIRHIGGAIVVVVLAFLLIPPLGAIGASLATLVASATSNNLTTFLYHKTRPVGMHMARSVLFPFRLKSLLRRK